MVRTPQVAMTRSYGAPSLCPAGSSPVIRSGRGRGRPGRLRGGDSAARWSSRVRVPSHDRNTTSACRINVVTGDPEGLFRRGCAAASPCTLAKVPRRRLGWSAVVTGCRSQTDGACRPFGERRRPDVGEIGPAEDRQLTARGYRRGRLPERRGRLRDHAQGPRPRREGPRRHRRRCGPCGPRRGTGGPPSWSWT